MWLPSQKLVVASTGQPVPREAEGAADVWAAAVCLQVEGYQKSKHVRRPLTPPPPPRALSQGKTCTCHSPPDWRVLEGLATLTSRFLARAMQSSLPFFFPFLRVWLAFAHTHTHIHTRFSAWDAKWLSSCSTVPAYATQTVKCRTEIGHASLGVRWWQDKGGRVLL